MAAWFLVSHMLLFLSKVLLILAYAGWNLRCSLYLQYVALCTFVKPVTLTVMNLKH